MVLVQKRPFFQLLFFRKYRPGKSPFRYSGAKKSLSRLYKKGVKKVENWHCSKGVNPWFWSKNGHYFNFYFLGNTGQENVFYNILERKNAFLNYKNKKFKKSKIDIFPKVLTHGFGPKMAIFPTFFFRQYRTGKCLLRYSRTKKHLFRL